MGLSNVNTLVEGKAWEVVFRMFKSQPGRKYWPRFEIQWDSSLDGRLGDATLPTVGPEGCVYVLSGFGGLCFPFRRRNWGRNKKAY